MHKKMTQEELDKRKIDINIMLGGTYIRDENLSFESKAKWRLGKGLIDCQQLYDFKYNRDWNQLMIVVNFIEELGYPVDICQDDCIIYTNIQPTNELLHIDVNDKLESTFIAVSDFAALYNNKELN
jgi:hypothetical protein